MFNVFRKFVAENWSKLIGLFLGLNLGVLAGDYIGGFYAGHHFLFGLVEVIFLHFSVFPLICFALLLGLWNRVELRLLDNWPLLNSFYLSFFAILVSSLCVPSLDLGILGPVVVYPVIGFLIVISLHVLFLRLKAFRWLAPSLITGVLTIVVFFNYYRSLPHLVDVCPEIKAGASRAAVLERLEPFAKKGYVTLKEGEIYVLGPGVDCDIKIANDHVSDASLQFDGP